MNMAEMFSIYGDFNIQRDSKTSFYIEFYYLEPKIVHTQTIEEFIQLVNAQKEKLGIQVIVPCQDAVKFKAHNRIE
jgi:hypothetical protein